LSPDIWVYLRSLQFLTHVINHKAAEKSSLTWLNVIAKVLTLGIGFKIFQNNDHASQLSNYKCFSRAAFEYKMPKDSSFA